MTAKILIADDHPIARSGVRAILASRPNLEICCEASNGGEALEGIIRYNPDIAVLDVNMPVMTGFSVAETVALKNLDTHILLYTMYYSEHLLREARRVGVQGYVSKTNAAKELLQAIDTLMQGRTYFCDQPSEGPRQNAARRPLVL
ncbi:MAG TPA: response regulator transcription factor [Terriglobales bacterium]|nr:response regulator transcription factor [Terriglobales bacterium]